MRLYGTACVLCIMEQLQLRRYGGVPRRRLIAKEDFDEVA